MISELENYIDIHLHILPGLDDGPKDMEESVRLACCYTKVGIKTVVATPHYLPRTAWAPSRETVIKSVDLLKIELDRQDIDLTILPGMEIAYHSKLQQRLQAGQLLGLGNSGYYLIEPSFHGSQGEFVAGCKDLLDKGYKLILGHPERIAAFQEEPELLRDLSDQGMLMQVTSDSLLGGFGAKTKKLAWDLCHWRCLDLIASDAHDSLRRPPFSAEKWAALLELPGGDKILKSSINKTLELFTAP